MKITPNERETLLGPLIIGLLAGLFAVVCVVSFASEYHSANFSRWMEVSDAYLAFFMVFFLVFVPLGAAPVMIARWGAKKSAPCADET